MKISDSRHTIAISVAASKFAACCDAKTENYAHDRQSAERIVKAYLDAAEAVCVPLETVSKRAKPRRML